MCIARAVPVASESMQNTAIPSSTALWTMDPAASRSIAENVMAVYWSLTNVSSIVNCCESRSDAVGPWKVIGTPSSAEARLAPCWAAVQNGDKLLVRMAYFAPAGGLCPAVASLIACTASSSSVGRYGFSSSPPSPAGPGVAVITTSCSTTVVT